MFDKIKSIGAYYTNIENLRDIRVLGMIVFGFLALLITWSGAKAIETNYQLQKQITALSQQNQLDELENANLKLQNQYYKSDQYLDLTARQNFGLAAPGETELMVSKEVAYQYATLPATKKQVVEPEAKAKQPGYQKNFQAWVNFFLHRQLADNV